MTTVAQLTIEMAANVARLQQDMAKATSTVDGAMGKIRKSADVAISALAAIGVGASVAGLANWVRQGIDAADTTSKLAQKTGLLTKEVAGLQLAFDQGGAGDKMEAAMARMSKAVVEGNKAFAAMGIEVTGAGGKLKSTREIFGEVSERIASYQDGLSKTAIVQEIFGKSGADLLPVLNGGSAALDEYDKKARALGLTLDEETTKAAEQFNDEMDIVMQRGQGIARQIAAELLPVLTQLSAEMAAGAQSTGSMSTAGAALATVLETIIVLGADVKYVLQQTGDTLGGLAAGYKEFFSGNLEGTREIGRQMRANGEAARAELDAFQRRILSARKISDSLKGAADFDEPRFRRAMTAGADTAKSLAPIVENAGAAAKKAKDEFAELYNKITAKDVGLDPSFYADLNTLYAGYQKGRIGVDEYRTAVENLVGTQRFAAEAAQALAKLQEEDAKANAAAVESRQAEAVSLQEQVAKERELIEVMGLTTSQVAALEAAKLEETAATKLRLATLADEIDWSGQMGEAYRQEAAQLQALAGLKREGAAKQVGIDAAKEAAKAWEKTSDSIEQSLTDALMRGFESGDSFGDNFAKSLVNTFKTYVARELATTLSRSLMSAFSGNAQGGGDWLSALAGLFGGGGQASGGGNLANTAQQLYGAWSGQGTTSMAGGGGGGINWIDAAQQLYGAWTGSGSTAIVAANAGTVNTTTLAGIEAASAGSTGVAGASTASTVGTGTAASAGASSWVPIVGWIYAALTTASGLYDRGYNRQALKGEGRSAVYEGSLENFQYKLMESIGITGKWTEIMTGATRMATLFGRRLKAYGMEGTFDGQGGISAQNYQYYEGGLFRSNKTRRSEMDPEQADRFTTELRNLQEGTATMARVLGYSSEAIEQFTGSVQINLRGLSDTEAAEKMAEELEKLQVRMAETVPGLENFGAVLEANNARLEAAGISAAGMADIIAQGMLGRMSASQVGEQLSEMVLGGIYNTIVSPFASQISQAFMTQIIAPMMLAVTTGGSVSTAISQASIDAVIATANRAIEGLNAILSDPEFQEGMRRLQESIGTISRISVKSAPKIKAYGSSLTAASSAAAQAAAAAKAAAEEQARAAQAIKDTWAGIADTLLDEMRRIRGELLGESLAGQSVTMADFALATAAARAGDQRAAEALPELAQAVTDMAKATAETLAQQQYTMAFVFNSLAQTRAIIGQRAGISLPAFADGGVHEGGWAMVGERGPELAYMPPARIYDADTSRAMLGGGPDMVGAISKLADRIGGLETAMRKVVDNTGTAARVLGDMQSDQQFVGASS